MTEKHLQKGDELPAYGGKLRLFSMRFCPYAHRTTLVLNAKRLPYDTVFINLQNKPEWIFKYNPKGAVPVLEIEEGVAIFDSGIINTYLDEKYPEIPLQHTDPLQRAQDKMIIENFASVSGPFYAAAFNPSALTDEMKTNFHNGLENLQKEYVRRGKKFLHEDEPGMVDYSIWPWLERILALPLAGQGDMALNDEKYEALLKYIELMKSTSAVKNYILPPETHCKFMETQRQGTPDYNMLDTSGNACCFRPRKKKE